MEQLAQACEPASFGKGNETVFDEAYRKAGKMDSELFSPMLDPSQTNLIKIIRTNLLEGTQGDPAKKTMKLELYKLNIYGTHVIFIRLYLIPCPCPGKGSFFKPHVETPRSEKMFGSLVIVFPTPHEGGALLLRHRGQEWSFDSGQALAAKGQPMTTSIGYVAFFSDIEHEVAPVTSGHRITLTYNLYFDNGGPVFANDAVSEHFVPPPLGNEGAFREAFTALLESPEFMASGGALAFGLRHVYQIQGYSLEHVYDILKGSDAIVYESVRMLGYEPVLYVDYRRSRSRGVILDKVARFKEVWAHDDVVDIVRREGGIYVADGDDNGWVETGAEHGSPEEVLEWVTPVTQFNGQSAAFPSFYGNEQEMNWVYGNVCLVVRFGKAGARLAYPKHETKKRRT